MTQYDSGIDIVHQFFPGTGSSYDHVVNFCTIGFDRYWKRRMLTRIPQASSRIMDQACGTGILTLKIARKFPDALIVGVDVTEEYLRVAKAKADNMKLDNVHFILGRAEDVLLDQRFDCITSSYLAKYAEIEKLIRNATRMLATGGVLIMHDFTYPSNHVFASIWELYFRLLQTAGARKYPQWTAVFDGLPALMRTTRWTAELKASLLGNNFSEPAVEYLTFGTSAIVTAKRL